MLRCVSDKIIKLKFDLKYSSLGMLLLLLFVVGRLDLLILNVITFLWREIDHIEPLNLILEPSLSEF